MADRRRRRHSENDSGEESSDVSFNTNAKVRLSECESESEHVDPELSEYESTADDSREVHETEDSDGEYETEEEVTAEEESEEEGDGKNSGRIDEERQSGDGEEQPDENLDDDEDKKNPAYIPRKGAFYEHDMRLDPDEEVPVNTTEPEEKRGKGKLWKDDSRWVHDKFDILDQAPKSREELIALYGYDITMDDKPPESAPRLNRRPRRGRGSKSNFQDFLPAGMNSKKSYSNDYPSLQEEYGGQSQSENQQNRPRRGRGQAQRRGQGQRRGNYSNMKDNYVQESKGYYENTRDKEFDRTVSDRNYPSGGDNYGQRNNYRNRDDGYSYERKDDFGNRDNFSRRDNYNNRNTFSGRENYSNQQNYEKRDNFGNRNNFGNKIDNRNNYRSQNKRGNYSDNQRENIDERGDNRRNYGDYTKEDNYRSGNFKGGNNTNPSRYNRDEHGSGRNEVSKESNHEGSNIYDRQSGYSRQKSGEYKRDGPSRYERQNSGGRNQDRSESKDFQKSHSPTREVKRSTLSSYSYHGDADRKSGSTYSKPSPKSYYSLSAMDDEISVTDNLEYDEIEYGQIQKEDMHDFNVTVTEGGSRRSMAKDKGRHVGNRGQDSGTGDARPGADERKETSNQGPSGSMKHQPQLPPRLQQQQKEQQERKRQQQQQQQQHQVQTQDVSQRSNKRYSSQRQRVAADTTGGQEGEAAQHSLPHGQPATILQAPYPQKFSPPKPVNPQQPIVMRQSLNQSPASVQKGQVVQGNVPNPQIVLARGPPPPHIVPVSPRVPPPPPAQGAQLRQATPQSISGQPVFQPGTIASPTIPVSVIGSPHMIGQTVVYPAPPPTYQIPIPQFPAPPQVPAVPVRPAVSQPANLSQVQAQAQMGETVRGGTTYYPQSSEVPVQGTGTTYYPPEMQVAKPNRVQIRRPKAAIPIVNPQDVKRDGEEEGIEYYETEEVDPSMAEYTEVSIDDEAVMDSNRRMNLDIKDEPVDGRLPVYDPDHHPPEKAESYEVDKIEHNKDEQIAMLNDTSKVVNETAVSVPSSVVFKQDVLSPTLSVSSVIKPETLNTSKNIGDDMEKTIAIGAEAAVKADVTETNVSHVKQEQIEDNGENFEDAMESVPEEKTVKVKTEKIDS